MNEYTQILEHKCSPDDYENKTCKKIGIPILKNFCESYYSTIDNKGHSVLSSWNNDKALTSIIRYSLGLDGGSVNNIHQSIIVQNINIFHLFPDIYMFKPIIAKILFSTYCPFLGLIVDVGSEFGGKMLGAYTAGRRYIGYDPNTYSELNRMIEFFKMNECKVSYSFYDGREETVDCYFVAEAFEELVDLKMVYQQLRKGSYLILHTKNDKMISLAKNIFGVIKEIISINGQKNGKKLQGRVCLYF
jgi:hypothetical protein